MPPTLSTDLINPEILAEDLMKGFSGKLTMAQSGALIGVTGLRAGREDVGRTVTVPYFEDGGEAQELTESQSGSLEKISQSSEEAVVVRLFKGFSMTFLAQAAHAQGRDIYEVAREMLQQAFARRVDRIAIRRALACATSGSMEYDGSAATITNAGVVETLKVFGEEIDDGMLAMWAMNSKPYWDAAQLADSTGQTFHTDRPGGRLSQLGGAPVRMTAQSDLVIAGSPTTYKSLLAKKGAVVAFWNEAARVDVTRDPTADVDIITGNAYCVIHAYGTMPGGTKPGVAVLKTR